MAAMAGMRTDSEMMQETTGTASPFYEHCISIAEPLQNSTPPDAISLSSGRNSMDEDWVRSMSLLAEAHQELINISSPAKTPETGEDADKEWCRAIIEEGRKTAKSQHQTEKLAKVPRMLRIKESNNPNLYTPSVICIGPYHYGKKKLRQEKLKAETAYKFVEGNGDGNESERLHKLFKKVEETSREVKKSYDMTVVSRIVSDDKEFSRMIFLDACFLLQFIHWSTSDYRSLLSVMSDHFARAVRQDLLLLENQLPFKVLTSVMDNKGEWENSFRRYFVRYVFRFRSPRVSVWQFLVEVSSVFRNCLCMSVLCHALKASSQNIPQGKAFKDNPQHLLAFFHGLLVNEQKIKETTSKHHLKYSAKELKRAGVKLQASWTCFITDVKYHSWLMVAGKLKLPQLTVDEYTKSMLLNLVAYEYCHEPIEKRWVTSYICFMDSLINDVEDVQVLRKSGILLNFRETDQAVADLFNNMGTYLIPNFAAYDDAKKSINAQCRNTIKKWVVEFLTVHFRTPWSVIAFLAAAFVIFLATVQAYLAVFIRHKK